MRWDYSSWVDFQVAVVEIFHDIIDEEIFFEFFLEDQHLEFGLYAVEGIKVPDLKDLRDDTWFFIGQDSKISTLFFLDFPLKTSIVFSNFKNFKIAINFINFIVQYFLLDKVEDSNSRILFFINTSNNLTMMNKLTLPKIGFFKGDGLIFKFYFAVLNCVVVQLEFLCHYEDFFLTEESNAEQFIVVEGIFLGQFVFL